MPKKSSPASSTPTDTPQSAHDIWLAGLGAMAQAQARGNQAFENLVQEGLAFQRQSQAQAQKRLEEAADRLTQFTHSLGQPSAARPDKLEHLFEERVARALSRLGMPSPQEWAHLQAQVQQLMTPPRTAPRSRSRPPAATPPSARPARKR